MSARGADAPLTNEIPRCDLRRRHADEHQVLPGGAEVEEAIVVVAVLDIDQEALPLLAGQAVAEPAQVDLVLTAFETLKVVHPVTGLHDQGV